MPQCRIHTNATCLKCGALEERMIRVGAFIMCEKCFKQEFKGVTDEIETGTKQYLNYLVWYKKYSEL